MGKEKAKRKTDELIFLWLLLGGMLYMLYLIADERNGVLRIVQLNAEIERQVAVNRKVEVDNDLLRAQIADVKSHPEIMEAMARYQLNMVRPGEIFVQTPHAK